MMSVQHDTFEAYDTARGEHDFAARCLLHEMIGYTGSFDAERVDPEKAAMFVRRYLPLIRAWDESRPEWVRP